MVELRKTNRYRLTALASYWWRRSDGVLQGLEGWTRDISTNGVFVLANPCPPVGARIQLEISLPRLEGDGTGRGVRLHGEGLVLRIERRSAESGFAASVQFYPAADEAVLVRTGLLGTPDIAPINEA